MGKATINSTIKPVWSGDLGNGFYQNPIIHADYSDPDVIRVGDDFFMVASSFNMSPCLPVLHSKDLVNWKVINHVSQMFPYERYDCPQHGDGVWAPSIRYHNGYYWVFFGAPDEGIFMSKTKDPFKEWSPFHLVKEVKGWIDPCPFWDEDGNAYLVNAFAKSRIGFKSILQIIRMTEDGTSLIGEGKIVFDGNLNHPTIEGPKLYKRNGYYYIFAPAGGVATGWQTVLRSNHIFGPYEDKVVLAQGNTAINGPHQGGWVELLNGDSWFIHFQDKGAYGRITHMQPMTWENDWPKMGVNHNEDGIGEPVLTYKKPNVDTKGEIVVPQTNDDFNDPVLGLQWQWKANWKKDWYSLEARKGWLRLYAVDEGTEKITDVPQIITQKFPAEEFAVIIKYSFSESKDGDEFYYVICGEKSAGLILKKQASTISLSYVVDEKTISTIAMKHSEGFFKIEVTDGEECSFAYSDDNENYHTFHDTFKATPGRWIGAQIGMYCKGNGEGYTDVDWITFTNTSLYGKEKNHENSNL
ncbi:glycoside hydrolase family 43 protein [Sutcliffiella rhizosphaerae]|uniref:Beta-xylosidase n=1 Tax=Sutcliffiella rhizosphaerae TaxID=2880967 RepID=A0ABM8YM15_9BACI|nr:glycoside hydrolase 43 family protein [Sutcliffiella rhizosphaerae]CAG9620949.1 Beta-xylosidase [Sutcliffiella rhizosphaerae]